MALAIPKTNPRVRRIVAGILIVAAIAEMTLMAQPGYDHVDRRWYPDAPAFVQKIREMRPGRFVGVGCLDPNIPLLWGLYNILGYDGVDPKPITELLVADQPPGTPPGPLQARLLNWKPRFDNQVLNMLGVRYLATNTPWPSQPPIFAATRLFVYENPAAMPMVYIPRTAITVNNQAQRLSMIVAREFQPAQLAIVESATPLTIENAVGKATLVSFLPSSVTVRTDMETPGLLVLAQSLLPGWIAEVNGTPTEILRTNHALCGVIVPKGASTIEFRYEPATFRYGAIISAASLTLVLALFLQPSVAGRMKVSDCDSTRTPESVQA